MHINIDINIKASEDITSSILTLAAVLHNKVSILKENPKGIETKEEIHIVNEVQKAINEKVETSKPEAKEITLQEVRDTLARLSKSGKQDQVKALIKKFESTKLTDIPKEKYGELLSQTNLIN